MKKIIITSFLILSVIAFGQNKKTVKASPFSTKNKSVTIYTSADSTSLRLTKTDSNLQFSALKQPLETQTCIFVDPDKKFQTFLGIGGAITDASAEVFAKLTPVKQQEFLDAYFSKENGIGYTLLRTNIHSCDFSSASYTYVEEGDAALKTFTIEHDKQFKIPLIKKAIERLALMSNSMLHHGHHLLL